MPYIDSAEREQLDHLVDELARVIRAFTDEHEQSPAFAGRLNYAITTLVLKTIPARRYWAIAVTTGVLHNVLDEFYRRYATPYETEQINKSGDVEEYARASS